MKYRYVLVALLALTVTARAGEIDPAAVQLWDVVYTNDGSVLKGVIVEEVPGQSLRIVIAGGSSLVVQMANVTKLGRELNPGYAMRAPVSGATPVDAGGPRLVAKSGLRIAVIPGIADHFDAGSSFLMTGRLGWELALDQWGLTVAGVGL